MATVIHPPRKQSGWFLLEALIALLIVTFGVLGSAGLLARAIQDVDEAGNLGEAAYLASWLVGQMQVSEREPVALDANFGSASAGPGYGDFRSLVRQRLPNAVDPVVTVAASPVAAATNALVTIVIAWTPPGDANRSAHRYQVTAAIGANP